ncbi:MAG: DUF1365 domain-containing protein [Pseudomonadota bacterium]
MTASLSDAPSGSAIYFGKVMHRRLKPVHHRFTYRVFSFLLDLDEIGPLAERLRWFSRAKLNLYSFKDRDYGEQSADDLAVYIRTQLQEAGIDGQGPLKLLCYPRILGYAFNPLAVYYCHDRNGQPSAILYEVSNTFGERHSYLIPVDRSERSNIAATVRQAVDKKFHVSPFMEMKTRYHFRVGLPGEDIFVGIHQTDQEGGIFHASFAGNRAELTDATLLRAFRDYPLMTLKVVAGIHYEAIRLIAKGMRLRAGGPTPTNPITLVANGT